MPTPNSKRDYAKEYRRDQSSPRDIANRSARNQLRRELHCGKGQEADHIRPLSKGGSKSKTNGRCISRHANRKKSDNIT